MSSFLVPMRRGVVGASYVRGVHAAFAKFAGVVPLPTKKPGQKEILDRRLEQQSEDPPQAPDEHDNAALDKVEAHGIGDHEELPRLLNRGAEPPPASPLELMDDTQEPQDPAAMQQLLIDHLKQRMHPAGML